MILKGLALLTTTARVAIAATLGLQNYPWGVKHFEALVSFGDSYTDDSRLGYFLNNNGSAPPVGWVNPPNYNSASGGRPWPQYVNQYGGLRIYNYAVSGAICSREMIPQQAYPDVDTYELPAFLADKAYTVPSTGKPFLDIPPQNTAYSIWIGTNDLGYNGFLTNVQQRGTNLTTYLDCVYNQIQRLYDSGARYFVIMDIAPLQLSPLYGFPEAGGFAVSQFWPNKTNATEAALDMSEQVATTNEIYRYRTESEVLVEKKFPGANFALFDMEGLISDIYYNPAQYLNGTAEPLNVTGVAKLCTVDRQCTTSTSPDSYLWFDELHPGEQADRVIAREFLTVLDGRSRWARYYTATD